jgi:signal peptidase I
LNKTLRETIETVVLALVIAMVIRTVAMESFVVQGSSMEPTLLNSERLLVNKLVYRFHPPSPGDVIVFRYPRAPDRDYVKRVVAVAGDTIEIKLGRVYVNGRLVTEPYLARAGSGSFPLMEVPAGHVFVLGDNRANSDDSRAFGPVPLDLIKGKAFFVFWPVGRMKALSSHVGSLPVPPGLLVGI